MRIFGGRGLLFLDGREVTISSGWLSLSEQLRELRKYNERLAKSDLTRLPATLFEGIQKRELRQSENDSQQYPSLSLELFSPAATAVASWAPLIDSCAFEEPGGFLDLLPPIREWRAGLQPVCALSIVELAFFDVGGLTIEEITEKVDFDSPQAMAGHEIALAVYTQGSNLRGYLRSNAYQIIAAGVEMTQLDALYPIITWDDTQGSGNGLRVFAERPDRSLKRGTLLPIVTERTMLARLS